MSTETPVPAGKEAGLPEPLPEAKKLGFLINRNFALLAIGQAISNMGDMVYSTTLLIWVYSLTHSAGAASGVLVAQYAPVFLLGPIAGVFVDRWNRRTTMIVSDLARGVATLLPFLVPVPLRLPAIYSSVFLIAAFSRFFTPAKSALLQVVVEPEEQAQAASISQSTFALSFIVGPAIATPLYLLVGPLVSSIINALSFGVSALSLRAIRASKEDLHPYAAVNAARSSQGVRLVMRELRDGFGFVLKTRVLLMITCVALIAMFGAGALNALDIVFVSHNLHASAALYGPLVALSGLGSLLGAILAGVITKKLSSQRLLTGSVLLTGAGILVYAMQTAYLPALILNFFLSLPQGGINVGFGPLLLNATPQAMMGRVQSVIETAMFGMSLLSIALAGYFGQFVPVNIIFMIGGVMIVLAGIFGWFALTEPQKPAEQRQTQE